MAQLSDLSIGFIVGGSVIFVSLILGFIVWKIIDSKRRAKPMDGNSHTGQPRVETGAANVHMGSHRDGRDRNELESAYADVHLEDDHHRTTANRSIDSGADERKRVATNDNTDDSGYCESPGFVGSEVYSRLHEVQNHVENVYNDFTDEDSGKGSHAGANSVSANSDDEHGSGLYTVVTPTRTTPSNQRDKNGAETTPRSDLLESENENYYSATLPRVDIIEVRRPAAYEVADGFNKNLDSERDDVSNSSRNSDAPSVQETPL
ncbi:hypothetical protein BsWGS_25689 [Bradybaena similaris]